MPQPDDGGGRGIGGGGLAKPAGSLGRLEDLSAWCAAWRSTAHTRYDPDIGVCRNHGVTAQGVSAFPPEVTHQMVANLPRGAAINQLAAAQGNLRVIDLDLDSPTADFTRAPAMSKKIVPPFTAGFRRPMRLPMC